MKIAYTMAPGRGETDRLLFALADDLRSLGYRICGTVQINTEREAHACDMDVQVLPNGPVLRISQSLGPEAKGCRLDPSALETAVGLVEASLDAGTDVLIVNKFGKHESDGRGFRSVIADALSRDIPVLVGVNAMNFKAFQEFAGPDATSVEPSLNVLITWLRAASDADREIA